MCVPFHALFSPSPREAAPSVSKFICDTSSGLVWSRGKAAHIIHVCVCRDTVCVCVCVLLFTYTVYWSVCSSVILFLHLCVYTGAYMFVLLTHEKVCVDTSVHASAAICMCVSFCMCVTFLCLCVMFMHTCVYAPPDMCECVRLCAPMRMYKYICVCVWASGVLV